MIIIKKRAKIWDHPWVMVSKPLVAHENYIYRQFIDFFVEDLDKTRPRYLVY